MGTPGIGLDKQAHEAMIKELEVTLADTFMIMIKTQGVHWNVTGSSFFSGSRPTPAPLWKLGRFDDEGSPLEMSIHQTSQRLDID